MLSRNKVVVMGLLAGAITWNSTRQLPYGIEAGVLGAWASVLPDLDAAYEFVCDHTKYPPAVQSVPFGRIVTGRLHSWGRCTFLHSVFGFCFFMSIGGVLTLLHKDSYARMELVVAAWTIFALASYLYRTILRRMLRCVVRVAVVYVVLVAVAMWDLWYGYVPGYRSLPEFWFTLALAIGVGGSIATETLSSRGAPLLWPIPWHVKVPLMGETGGLRETWAVALFLVVWTIWWCDHYPSFHGIVITFIPSVLGLIDRLRLFILRML